MSAAKPYYVWADVNDPNFRGVDHEVTFTSKRAALKDYAGYLKDCAPFDTWTPKLVLYKVVATKVKT
jgi:hypothetical protein